MQSASIKVRQSEPHVSLRMWPDPGKWVMRILPVPNPMSCNITFVGPYQCVCYTVWMAVWFINLYLCETSSSLLTDLQTMYKKSRWSLWKIVVNQKLRSQRTRWGKQYFGLKPGVQLTRFTEAAQMHCWTSEQIQVTEPTGQHTAIYTIEFYIILVG